MDDDKEQSSLLDRIYDSVDRKLNIEKLDKIEIIYSYPRYGEPVLWVDLHTNDIPFNAWYYSNTSSTEPDAIREIPASTNRSVIHFLPPQAIAALNRRTEEDPSWLYDEEFLSKKPGIVRQNLVAFVDLLNTIKKGELSDTEYLIGQTNFAMANFVLRLGFKRCWEGDAKKPNLVAPIKNEDSSYKIGVSVKELKDMYNLDNEVPTASSVINIIKRNKQVVGRSS